jgi:hypothetical protein
MNTVEDRLEALTSALFYSMNVGGVYARSAAFEQVIDGLSTLISRHRDPKTEILRFPPVMSRTHIEKSGYLHSFPHLLGAVSCLHGTEDEIRSAVEQSKVRGDWANALVATDLVLSPAACYPLYPLVAARGPVPLNGLLFDVACDCFRHEATQETGRLQSFRMREFVCVGTPDHVVAFRERWISQSQELANLLGLSYQIEQASDPFFGRTGKLMAISLHELQLPSRPFWSYLELAGYGRRCNAYRLCGFWTRPTCFGSFCEAWIGYSTVAHTRRRVSNVFQINGDIISGHEQRPNKVRVPSDRKAPAESSDRRFE